MERLAVATASTVRRRWRTRAIVLVLVAAAIGVAQWPTTTRYGVNFQQFSREIPLYEKAVNFVSRDLQTRRLAREVTGGAATEREILQRIFSWVTVNIRPQPEGFPVIDDHIWNIIVRGYGIEDQRTEVFTMLVSYACCPATAVRLTAEPTKAIIVAVVLMDDEKPRVFDVANALVFKNEAGDFATAEDLLHDPELVDKVSRGMMSQGVPYRRYFSALADLHPIFARMERQKPWARLKDELGGLLPGTR